MWRPMKEKLRKRPMEMRKPQGRVVWRRDRKRRRTSQTMPGPLPRRPRSRQCGRSVLALQLYINGLPSPPSHTNSGHTIIVVLNTQALNTREVGGINVLGSGGAPSNSLALAALCGRATDAQLPSDLVRSVGGLPDYLNEKDEQERTNCLHCPSDLAEAAWFDGAPDTARHNCFPGGGWGQQRRRCRCELKVFTALIDIEVQDLVDVVYTTSFTPPPVQVPQKGWRRPLSLPLLLLLPP